MATTDAWLPARPCPDGEVSWNPNHSMVRMAFFSSALQHLIYVVSTASAWAIAIASWDSRNTEQWLFVGKQLLAIASYTSLLLWYAMAVMVFFWVKPHTAGRSAVAAFVWRRTRWSFAVMGLTVAFAVGLNYRVPLVVIPWVCITGTLSFIALWKSWGSWREIHRDGTIRPLHPHPSTAVAPEAQRTIYRRLVGEQWDVPAAIRDPHIATKYAASARESATRRRTVAALVQVLSISGLVPGLLWYFNDTPANDVWCVLGVIPLATFVIAVTESAKAGRYDDLAKEYQDRSAKISPDFL